MVIIQLRYNAIAAVTNILKVLQEYSGGTLTQDGLFLLTEILLISPLLYLIFLLSLIRVTYFFSALSWSFTYICTVELISLFLYMVISICSLEILNLKKARTLGVYLGK